MRQNKGVTLTGLSLYVVMMSFVIAALSSVTIYFSKNYEYIESDGVNAAQYNRLMSYLIKDCKEDDIEISEIEESFLKLSNGIMYTFSEENKTVYRDKVKVAEDIENCVFSQTDDGVANNYIEVEVTTGIDNPLITTTKIGLDNL